MKETRMTADIGPPTSPAELVRRLRELIVALDERLPHVERAGEAAIARDAAALKAKALRRIADIEAQSRADGHNADRREPTASGAA
jgi:hypothetical protein